LLSDLKSLVFDLDGTLYVNKDLGREIHLCGCRYIGELMGTGVTEAGELIRATKKRLKEESGFDSSLSHACLELGGDLRKLHRRFIEEIYPERFLCRDERVVRLLQSLGSRFDLYIYTNNNTHLSLSIIETIGVLGLFRKLFTIEDSWRPKPDMDALNGVYGAMGRKPDECMFIGDRYDIDLRLPAAMGSTVFLAKSVEELLPLIKLMQ
jgi:putative hydrolase of the HAD superfamily